MRSVVVVSLLVLPVLATLEANAQPAPGNPSGAAGPPLPAAVPPPPSSAVGRRPVELVPTLGLAIPSCVSGDTDERCEGLEGGIAFGFAAFWRVTPHFAWGGGFDIAGFQYTAADSLEMTDTAAGAAWIGLLGRAYFFDEGNFDPYVQLGLGGGALGTTGTVPTGEKYEETGAGPSIQVGGGIDFVLAPRIKLGPAIAYTHVFVDKIRRCRANSGGDCTDIPRDEAGHLTAFLMVSGRLTIMLGDEL